MNKHDRVMEIFLNECREVLEEVAPKFLNLEESPNDKNLINDIFRGIHTLKGNANSFGFVKLGEFVHHFEDLLSLYRKDENVLHSSDVDLFIRSFDMVAVVFDHEESALEGYPPNYSEILNEIKKALHFQDNKEEVVYEDIVNHSDFSNTPNNSNLAMKMLKYVSIDDDSLKDAKLYDIEMNLDSDIYLRGYNHQIFFRLLREHGKIIFSHYTFSNELPLLDNFDTELSYIKTVHIFLLSQNDASQIADVFEFIAEEHEVSISMVLLPQ